MAQVGTRRIDWNDRYLTLAKSLSLFSKDPSTKVGAVITRPNHTVASIGYNGFPRGIEDTSERLNNRDLKYKLVVHAEMNAILNVAESLTDYTLYCTHCPCERCAVHILQTGISKVVVPIPEDHFMGRWSESIKFAHSLFVEAGVEITYVKV